MVDWDVGRSYAALADTIMTGAAGIGKARAEGQELGLKKAQLETEAALFDKYQRPAMEAANAKLALAQQPFVGSLWGDDPMDEAHAAVDFVGDISEALQADYDPKTKRWKRRAAIPGLGEYVTNQEMQDKGARIVAIMVGKTDVGRMYEDKMAQAQARLSAAEKEEAAKPPAPDTLAAAVSPSGVSLAGPAVAPAPAAGALATAVNSSGLPLSPAGPTAAPGASPAPAPAPPTAVGKAKAELAAIEAQRQAYAENPLPFKEKQLDFLYAQRTLAIEKGMGPDSLGSIDVSINRVNDEVKRLRELEGSDRETRPVSYWASLMPNKEAADKFLARFNGDGGKLLTRFGAKELAVAIGEQIKDAKDNKTIAGFIAEGGLTSSEAAEVAALFKDKDLVVMRTKFEGAVNSVKDLQKTAAANAQRAKEQATTFSNQKSLALYQFGLHERSAANAHALSQETGGGAGTWKGGKGYPLKATVNKWAALQEFSGEDARQFKALFPNAGAGEVPYATVMAAMTRSPYFGPAVQKEIDTWEVAAKNAWTAMDATERTGYNGGYAKHREDFIPKEIRTLPRVGKAGVPVPVPEPEPKVQPHPTGKAAIADGSLEQAAMEQQLKALLPSIPAGERKLLIGRLSDLATDNDVTGYRRTLADAVKKHSKKPAPTGRAAVVPGKTYSTLK